MLDMLSGKTPWCELLIPDQLVKLWGKSEHLEQSFLDMKQSFIVDLGLDMLIVVPKEPPVKSAGCMMGQSTVCLDWRDRYFIPIQDSRLYFGSGIRPDEYQEREYCARINQFNFDEFRYWSRLNYSPLVLINGPFSEAMFTLGYEEFLNYFNQDAAQLVPIMQSLMEEQIDLALIAQQHGATGVVIGDDFAHANGLMIEKEYFEFFVLPIYKQAIARLHQHSLPVVLHCDGNFQSVLDKLLAVGFDGIQGMEWASVRDLAHYLEKYQLKIFVGNLSPEYLSFEADDTDLRTAVQELVSLLKKYPNYLFGTSSGLSSDMDLTKLKLLSNLVLR